MTTIKSNLAMLRRIAIKRTGYIDDKIKTIENKIKKINIELDNYEKIEYKIEKEKECQI